MLRLLKGPYIHPLSLHLPMGSLRVRRNHPLRILLGPLIPRLLQYRSTLHTSLAPHLRMHPSLRRTTPRQLEQREDPCRRALVLVRR